MNLSDTQATAIVAPYGFVARIQGAGFFIAPLHRDRFGHRHVGDDAMHITGAGEITVYAADAQAFLAATALANALKPRGKQ